MNPYHYSEKSKELPMGDFRAIKTYRAHSQKVPLISLTFD